MPFLILILLCGVLAYLWWRRHTTTLTRQCRWREDRRVGGWHCAACGARLEQVPAPKHCLRSR